MSKKVANMLITTFIVLIGGYFLFRFLPTLIAFAGNIIYLFLSLGIIALLIYGIFKLVSFLNR